jgi:hypothetical protein
MASTWGMHNCRLHCLPAIHPEFSYGLRNDVGLAQDRAGIIHSIGMLTFVCYWLVSAE